MIKEGQMTKPSDLPIPISTTFDLTEACNLRCDYCFTWTQKHKRRVMSEITGKRIIDWWLPQAKADEDSKIQIAWWGGEPLLEWELLKTLLKYSKKKADELGKPIEFGGTTNGLLYTPDKVEWCLKNDSMFLVSLDGIEPAHDFHRKRPDGSGSWKIVDKNLREALKIAPFQRVRTSFSAETIKYFFDSVQYFVEDLGIDNFAFSPVYESNWDERALDMCREQFELATDYAIKRAKEGKPIVMKHINDEANIFDRVSQDGQPLHRQNPCGAGSGYTGWSVDGFCFPCHRFNKHGISPEERAKLPTVIAKPVGDSFEWVNFEWRENFYKWKDRVPEDCLACEAYCRSTCNGGCYAVNFDLTNGNIFGHTDAICGFAKIQQEAGINYFKKAKEAGVEISTSGWGENIKKKVPISCVCNNMCYSEGTQDEIVYMTRAVTHSCLCDHANYTGERHPPSTRTREQIDQDYKQTKDFLELSKRIFLTYNQDKTDEQRELESKVIERTLDLIDRSIPTWK